MRLTAGDIPRLPAAVALRDRSGEILAASPEWQGPGPATLTYPLGQTDLLVASDRPNHSAEWAVDELLATIGEASREMDENGRARAQMLAAALGVAAARVPTDRGTLQDVQRFVKAGAAVRCQARITFDHDWPADQVAAPAALAVAIVQMAVNLETHESAREIRVGLEPGPTFRLSCALQPGAARAHLETSRAAGARRRWGAAYCRHIADALGGSISDPLLDEGNGRREIFLGLGAIRLALPVARVREGRVMEATPAWVEETGTAAGAILGRPLDGLVAEASAQGGSIVANYPYRARATDGSVWVMMAINDGDDIIREVVNGLFHERALWHGREPAATSVYALSWILAHRLGTPWQPKSPLLFSRTFAEACSVFGITSSFDPATLRCPDGQVTAYVISVLGGELIERPGGQIRLQLGQANALHPLAELMHVEGGEIDLTPPAPDAAGGGQSMEIRS